MAVHTVEFECGCMYKKKEGRDYWPDKMRANYAKIAIRTHIFGLIT